jgi:hypothetical protein
MGGRLSIHAAACVSLVVYGLLAAGDGAVKASSGGLNFAAGGTLVGGVGVAAVAVYALIDDTAEFDGWQGVVVVLGVAAYTAGTVVGLIS